MGGSGRSPKVMTSALPGCRHHRAWSTSRSPSTRHRGRHGARRSGAVGRRRSGRAGRCVRRPAGCQVPAGRPGRARSTRRPARMTRVVRAPSGSANRNTTCSSTSRSAVMSNVSRSASSGMATPDRGVAPRPVEEPLAVGARQRPGGQRVGVAGRGERHDEHAGRDALDEVLVAVDGGRRRSTPGSPVSATSALIGGAGPQGARPGVGRGRRRPPRTRRGRRGRRRCSSRCVAAKESVPGREDDDERERHGPAGRAGREAGSERERDAPGRPGCGRAARAAAAAAAGPPAPRARAAAGPAR